jgi:hypothetical protein
MWLLETSTLELRDFVGARIPPYAILSHTWGDYEVTFKDMRKHREVVKNKAGYTKIEKCCEKAREDGHQYVWIGTRVLAQLRINPIHEYALCHS